MWHLYGEPRPFQLEDSIAMVDSVKQGFVPILNEPPGFGKTRTVLNALMHIASISDTILILVPTKMLAVHWENEILSTTSLSVAKLYGKRNFKCLLTDTTADDTRIVCNLTQPLVTKLVNCKHYGPPIQESTYDMYKQYVRPVSEKRYDALQGVHIAYMRESGLCEYYAHIYDAVDKQVIVTTISMAVALAARGILPRPSILVVDEVDELPFRLLRDVTIDYDVVDDIFETARKYAPSQEAKQKLLQMRHKALMLLKSEEKNRNTALEISSAILPALKLILRHVFSADLLELHMALNNINDVYFGDDSMSVVLDMSKHFYNIVKAANTVVMTTGSPLDETHISTILKYFGLNMNYRVISSVPYFGRGIYVYFPKLFYLTSSLFVEKSSEICSIYVEMAKQLLDYSEKMFGVRKLYIPVIAYRYIHACNLHNMFQGSLDVDNKNAVKEFLEGDREVLISYVAARGLNLGRGAVMIMKLPMPSIDSSTVKHVMKQPYGVDYVTMYARSQVLQMLSRFLRSQDSEVIVGTLDARVVESILMYKSRGGKVYQLNGTVKELDEDAMRVVIQN